MITLYRTDPCEECETVADALRSMVISHDVVTLDRGAQTDALPPGTELPAIDDGGRIVAGGDIGPYLRELDRVLTEWNRFQGDSCYIDADGTVC